MRLRLDDTRRALSANRVPHMELLVDGGVVSREQLGKWARYRVANATIDAVFVYSSAPLSLTLGRAPECGPHLDQTRGSAHWSRRSCDSTRVGPTGSSVIGTS